jgi:NlpC/P60 family putative phage cell wall peptidase
VVDRDAVVAEARSWIGTRWQHQQYTKGVATDCIGLIGGVALALGLPGGAEWRDTPAFHNYGRAPDPQLLIAGCDLLMDRIPIADVQVADVLLFRFRHDPQHFALVSQVSPLYIIHAYAQARRVTENRVDAVTGRMRQVAAYRLRGVE